MRDVTQLRQVTNVVPEQSSSIAPALADAGKTILAAQQETKINNNLSKAQLEISNITNKYRIDNEGNPEINSDKYKQEVDTILSNYGSDVSPMFRRQWLNQTQQIKTQAEAENQAWVYKQSATNAKNNINESMTNNFDMSYIDGQNYADGTSSDISALWKFEKSRKDLEGVSSKYLGSETVNQLMIDYQKDYFKSFLSGSIENNPEKGLKLLENEEVKKQFSPIDLDDMKIYAKKRAKQIKIDNLQNTFLNSDTAFNLVNDQTTTIFEKTKSVDNMLYNKSIDNKTAALLKRNITSTSKFNSEKNAESVSELVLQIQSLSTDDDIEGEEYLNGLQNVRNNIIDYQTKGFINADDAFQINKSLNNVGVVKKEVKSLKELSSDWSWGFDNDDAMDMFRKQMPNEQIAYTAFRDYFYATSEKNYDADTRKKIALGITRGLNKKRFTKESMKQSKIKSFNSVEEAEKANLPKGSIVYINGKKARID